MESTALLRILDELSDLKKQLKSLTEPKVSTRATRSEQVNELYTALAKAQGEMNVAGKNSENPYFKSRYADFCDIVKASRPALTRNGLSVIQQILVNDDGSNVLYTILTHSSGQFIESAMRILPQKLDIQSIGSYIAYLKRYCYAALIGVVVSDEDDD